MGKRSLVECDRSGDLEPDLWCLGVNEEAADLLICWDGYRSVLGLGLIL